VDRFSEDVPIDVYAAVGSKDAVTDAINAVNWTHKLAAELVRRTGPAIIVMLHRSLTAAEILKNLGASQVKADLVLGVREYFNDLTGPLWENIGQCTCLLAAPSTLSIPKIKK
jgi:hypothetical protein